MPFSDAEVYRIKHELGMNLLNVGADAYVGVHQIIDVVIQNYIAAEVSTTSATAVTASATPAPVTLTLTSATGFAAGDRVIVDVDSRKELVTIQALSGSDITVQLSKAHSGTYPVSVEGPISMAVDILGKIADVKTKLSNTFGEGALKKVDEIEFYNTGSSLFGSTGENLKFWRDELASLLGCVNMWNRRQSAGSRTAVY